ncbi:aminotransferase-like domain-containing protein [Urechidicola croceus]|nr:PLP-dependent aminotransferase family protein [Urechidicola croceus]
MIKSNTLPSGTRLPGSRNLATLLNVHRKTIVASYEELILQGWIESVSKKGTFVNKNIPLLKQEILSRNIDDTLKLKSGFYFDKNPFVHRKLEIKKEGITYINDGVSDVRLTPVDEIAILYRKLSNKKATLQDLSYGTTYGNDELRTVLVSYLNETRGLNITKDNIMITRGSQMGMYLSSSLLIKKDDYVIVGETNYISTDLTFKYKGAKLLRVPVDENGLIINEVEQLCKKYTIKAIYVTSHHHHPTTVTLSAERRMHLLNLALTYNFAIIEDDYDYDFHYNHAPILPLASHDKNGSVIYVGSVCKTVAPAYRVGYLVASKEFVDECAKLRRFVDRQGDSVLELAFAHFIKNGDLDRHIKKALKIYRERRDYFCYLLQKELGDYFQFEIPKGGMAIWITLDKKYSWEQLSENAKKVKLDLGDWIRYDAMNLGHNAIRMGFASYTINEIEVLIHKLKFTMKIID